MYLPFSYSNMLIPYIVLNTPIISKAAMDMEELVRRNIMIYIGIDIAKKADQYYNNLLINYLLILLPIYIYIKVII
jgi:hypothetical protein